MSRTERVALSIAILALAISLAGSLHGLLSYHDDPIREEIFGSEGYYVHEDQRPTRMCFDTEDGGTLCTRPLNTEEPWIWGPGEGEGQWPYGYFCLNPGPEETCIDLRTGEDISRPGDREGSI